MNDLLSKLALICGQKNVLFKADLMQSYTTDWRKRYTGSAIAVVTPESTSQIQELVKLCKEQSVAIIPQGGNTSTCGGATPLSNYIKPQIIINLAKMNKIIAIDTQNNSIQVEAGCTLQQVQDYAKKHQRYFPLSLASQGSCQIGGNIATNAGGIQVIKYGMMRELILGLSAVMHDATIFSQNQALRKNNMYLDLKQLLIGSEGTLGIITQATLKLYPLPKGHCTFLVAVSSLAASIDLLNSLQKIYGNSLSAFEIIKAESQEIYIRYFPEKPLPLRGEWLVLAEIETNQDFNAEHILHALIDLMIDPNSCLICASPEQQKELWHIRESLPLAEKMHGYAAKHDIALPLSQLDNFLKLNMPKLKNLAPNGYFSIFGHLGDGNLHYNFGIPNANQTTVNKLEALISPIVYADVVTLGGSIAAEHGIGQSKRALLQQFLPPTNYVLLQQIKQLLDPDQLFNPEKAII